MIDDETADGLRPVRRVVYSLGSNMDDRVEYLRTAFDAIAATPQTRLVGVSPVFETRAIGDEQPDFLNAVVVVDSTLPSLVLLERAQAIEMALGRPRDHGPGPRPIDIDLVAVGSRIRTGDRLTLPHPRAHQRAFVLIPWLAVDPDAVLPGFGPVKELVPAVAGQVVRRTNEVIEA